MDWVKYVITILSGLASAIPLVILLVKYVKQAIMERNWKLILNKVISLMETAETKFENGADRKDWVIAMLRASAGGINYNIDYNAIGEMIDTLCEMAKAINNKQKAGK